MRQKRENESCCRKLINWSQREMEPLFCPSAPFPNHYQASSMRALVGAKLRHGCGEWLWGSWGSLLEGHRDSEGQPGLGLLRELAWSWGHLTPGNLRCMEGPRPPWHKEKGQVVHG